MEEKNFPIIIKKKNSFMIVAVVLEFIVALIYAITQGFFSILSICFFVVAIITALAVWVEFSRDIYLKEHKVEFYENKNLIAKIKYSNIVSLSVENGEEEKNKKKEFFTITYRETSNKKHSDKVPKTAKYFVNPMHYTGNDLKTIRDMAKSKNSEIIINENISKLIKE